MAIDTKIDELPLTNRLKDTDYLVKQDYNGDTTKISVETFVDHMNDDIPDLKTAEAEEDTFFLENEKGSSTVERVTGNEILTTLREFFSDAQRADEILDAADFLVTTGEDVGALNVAALKKHIQSLRVDSTDHADLLKPNTGKSFDEYTLQQIYDYMPEAKLNETLFVVHATLGTEYYDYNGNLTDNENKGDDWLQKLYITPPESYGGKYFYIATCPFDPIHFYIKNEQYPSSCLVSGFLKMGIASYGDQICIGYARCYYEKNTLTLDKYSFCKVDQLFIKLPYRGY